jgi:hypothetical protein
VFRLEATRIGFGLQMSERVGHEKSDNVGKGDHLADIAAMTGLIRTLE